MQPIMVSPCGPINARGWKLQYNYETMILWAQEPPATIWSGAAKEMSIGAIEVRPIA